MVSIKRTFLTLCLALIAIAGFAQNEAAWKALEKPLNFYLVNDLGRNGYMIRNRLLNYWEKWLKLSILNVS